MPTDALLRKPRHRQVPLLRAGKSVYAGRGARDGVLSQMRLRVPLAQRWVGDGWRTSAIASDVCGRQWSAECRAPEATATSARVVRSELLSRGNAHKVTRMRLLFTSSTFASGRRAIPQMSPAACSFDEVVDLVELRWAIARWTAIQGVGFTPQAVCWR